MNQKENYREYILRRVTEAIYQRPSQTDEQTVDLGQRLESLVITVVFAVFNELYILIYYYSFFYAVILINQIYYK